MAGSPGRRAEVDTTVPSVARCYDYALGGKDNFEVDRAAVRAVEQVVPQAGTLAKVNRAWHVRATRWLAATAGIGQYLDLGAGLPTAENTHEIVQRIDSQARVVYVDNDPSAVAHGEALLDGRLARYVEGDLTKPEEVLADPVVASHLDFREPVALYQCATLHHQPDGLDVADIMRRYTDALAPGSYVVLSHFWDPADHRTERVHKIRDTLRAHGLDVGFRTTERVAELFGCLEMIPSSNGVDEGPVPLLSWWPDGPVYTDPDAIQWCIVGGIGRKG